MTHAPPKFWFCQSIVYQDGDLESVHLYSKLFPKVDAFSKGLKYSEHNGGLENEPNELECVRQWVGFTLTDTDFLQVINLPKCSLTGELPIGIFRRLKHLQYLNLSENALSGEIPCDIATSEVLVGCNLSYNHFCGPIPLTLGERFNSPLGNQLQLHKNWFYKDPSWLIEDLSSYLEVGLVFLSPPRRNTSGILNGVITIGMREFASDGCSLIDKHGRLLYSGQIECDDGNYNDDESLTKRLHFSCFNGVWFDPDESVVSRVQSSKCCQSTQIMVYLGLILAFATEIVGIVVAFKYSMFSVFIAIILSFTFGLISTWTYFLHHLTSAKEAFHAVLMNSLLIYSQSTSRSLACLYASIIINSDVNEGIWWGLLAASIVSLSSSIHMHDLAFAGMRAPLCLRVSMIIFRVCESVVTTFPLSFVMMELCGFVWISSLIKFVLLNLYMCLREGCHGNSHNPNQSCCRLYAIQEIIELGALTFGRRSVPLLVSWPGYVPVVGTCHYHRAWMLGDKYYFSLAFLWTVVTSISLIIIALCLSLSIFRLNPLLGLIFVGSFVYFFIYGYYMFSNFIWQLQNVESFRIIADVASIFLFLPCQLIWMSVTALWFPFYLIAEIVSCIMKKGSLWELYGQVCFYPCSCCFEVVLDRHDCIEDIYIH